MADVKYKVNANGRKGALGYGSLPFDAQIAFFRNKLALPTRTWTDIWQANHDHAFVVAGANKMALVEDLQAAVQKAIAQGTTLTEFRKDFDAAVKAHGWSYNGSRGWRTQVIYHTNLRSSYNAGRFEQLQKFPYWQYHHSIASQNARPQHLVWDKLVLPANHAFWLTHYPPNGWGCNCSVTGLSDVRLKARGLSVSEAPVIKLRQVEVGKNGLNPRAVEVPEGISPGFAYAPGRSAWMHSHVPTPLGKPPHGFDKMIPATSARDLLPEPRVFAEDKILAKGLSDDEYVAAFLSEFGAAEGAPVVFYDVAGEALVISSALFRNIKGKLKVTKRGREPYVLMLAEAIRNPDEIWTNMEWNHALGKAMVRRRYVARFEIADGSRDGFAVFEYGRDGWAGVTTYARDFSSLDELDAEVEGMRRGVRLYKRGL
ncbi:MAG: hypothetical protein AUK35_09695 [Zetaproteobacteria bacterium CG2_30_46_52]|nr:MAG: hypothetical protein AUK35_09695 [Zetaproteobacteria bacterium CG2_30_46_52]